MRGVVERVVGVEITIDVEDVGWVKNWMEALVVVYSKFNLYYDTLILVLKSAGRF